MADFRSSPEEYRLPERGEPFHGHEQRNDLSLLPLFLTSVVGAGTTFVGLLEGFAEVTASLLKLFWGWFSDRRGKRKTLD